MSRRAFLVESDGDRLRAVLIVDGRLQALEIDSGSERLRPGAVVPVKVARIVGGLGAIVALPDGREALLERGSAGQVQAGAIIPAQISRPARGDKLMGATRTISRAGRFLIHSPLETGVRVSRRFAGPDSLRLALIAALRNQPGGWIVRHAASHRTPEDLVPEIAALAGEGRRVAEGEPSLPAPDALRRLAADWGSTPPERILVDGKRADAAVADWIARFAPDWAALVVAHGGRAILPRPATLFDAHDLDSAIAALGEPRVALPGGGSLVIEQTEALLAIDVNGGGDANALSVNLAASAEIARQLRLRHIGGMIVIDFISMSRRDDRDRVSAALAAALADDPAQTRILPISALGLVEMTRERRGPGLARKDLESNRD